MELDQDDSFTDQARQHLKIIFSDDYERAEAIEKARRDMIAIRKSKEREIWNKAWDQGWNQGWNQACEQASIQTATKIAKNMLDRNYSLDNIQKLTGLSYDQIKSIK